LDIINFYVDDSGARHPGRAENQTWNAHCHWFALGGILIAERDEEGARQLVDAFRARWPQMKDAPLHSYEIRNRRDGFHWLKTAGDEQHAAFMRDLSQLMGELPMLGVACVVDGPGYNARYHEKYGERRWMMCKTAFVIAIERAVKHALTRKAKLRVLVERSDKTAERDLLGYYDSLRRDGHPFDAVRAGGYEPLSKEDYALVLYEFAVKQKSSPMIQLADLVLWPLCRGGYDAQYAPYTHLRATRKLLDCIYPGEEVSRGTKYSCFDLWRAGQQKSKTPR